MNNVKFKIIVTLLVLMSSACSLKIETLYHGQTPIGIQDTKATALRADADRQYKTK